MPVVNPTTAVLPAASVYVTRSLARKTPAPAPVIVRAPFAAIPVFALNVFAVGAAIVTDGDVSYDEPTWLALTVLMRPVELAVAFEVAPEPPPPASVTAAFAE